jgi:LuxR family maltose regulon positive regulatory protein
MDAPVLVTKLYAPPPRPGAVPRPRLSARLDAGLRRRLTLVSAPAGSGKTTLVGAWVAGCGRRAAWLSLDAGDSDPARFLAHLVAALRTVAPGTGAGVLAALQSPQPPPIAATLATLLNELATLPEDAVLVLDDYHLIDARPVDEALAFLVEHLPQTVHLVLATREDPPLPLARLRARGQLTELRAADLRFTAGEAADFLNQTMGLDLAAADVAALEARTEGWIAGLQLAALSLQGHGDAAGFIASFTGGHHFVLDYLVEEVLHRQPAGVQAFLLHTSILDRLCGPLCDAVLLDHAAAGQATLEYLARANLFLEPLDDERRWYRYHQLFADLLRRRLHQGGASPAGDAGRDRERASVELHRRASQWHEDHGLELEAFRHAIAADDVERAERLLGERGMPRHTRVAATAALGWLASLPATVLDARPALRWRHAWLLLTTGQTAGVEKQLQAAEAALRGTEADDATRNLVGQIAAARAVLALTRYQIDAMLAQAHRALDYLAPDNLAVRTSATWALGVGHQQQGDRAAAGRAFTDAIALGQAAGNRFTTILATKGLGDIQLADNRLHQAAETYRRVLHLLGDEPPPVAGEAHLGLARICYEWDDLDAAERHGRQALHLARQYGSGIDRSVLCEVLLARLRLARGDVAGAAALLARAAQSVRQHNFAQRLPDVAAAQVATLLRQGNLAAAARLAEAHDLPLVRAQVHLARGDAPAALAALAPVRRHAEARGWADERLAALALQALAHHAQGDRDDALCLLAEALALAEAGGVIRRFVDEGPPMARLLDAARAAGGAPAYLQRLLAAFSVAAAGRIAASPSRGTDSDVVEPLSAREREVLGLIAAGLTNQDVAARLYLSLHTVKVHARNIYAKLGVANRTQAAARGKALGIVAPPPAQR